MNVFTKTNNKTAKDHIIEKRNRNIFVDLKNNSTSNKLGCVKSNKVTKFNNHSNLLNITHGYYDYYQNGKCRDICNNLFSEEYETEIFRNKICSITNNYNETNKDVSHNYSGMTLIDDEYPQNSVISTADNTITHYTNIETSNAATNDVDSNNYFKYKSKKEKTKCFQINSKDIIVE